MLLVKILNVHMYFEILSDTSLDNMQINHNLCLLFKKTWCKENHCEGTDWNFAYDFLIFPVCMRANDTSACNSVNSNYHYPLCCFIWYVRKPICERLFAQNIWNRFVCGRSMCNLFSRYTGCRPFNLQHFFFVLSGPTFMTLPLCNETKTKLNDSKCTLS